MYATNFDPLDFSVFTNPLELSLRACIYLVAIKIVALFNFFISLATGISVLFTNTSQFVLNMDSILCTALCMSRVLARAHKHTYT